MDTQGLRRIVAIALVVLYAVGLGFLFFGKMQIGLALWVISTAGGLLLLYLLKKREESAPGDKSTQPRE